MSLMDLLPHFQQTLIDLGLSGLPHGEPRPVVVGVSGGPDSLAMLHLFVRVRKALNLAPYAVHVNHSLRGEEADEDAQAVEAIAAAWGVPCHVERVDVPALAAEHRLSVEEAARQARYTMLGQVAVRIGAEAIAVAHNADDQAETVLMHLLRGAGLAGLRGMLPVTPLSEYHLLAPVGAPLVLVRPLLDVPRAQIEAYCAGHDLSPRFDRSNLDTTYFRNRLRHEVIPYLEQINPNLREMLVRTASVLAADYEIVREQADAAWLGVTREVGDDRVRFNLAGWRGLPLALQRALIRRAVWTLRSSLRDVSFEHVEAAVRVGLYGETGAEATLPAGLLLRVGYDELIIAGQGARSPRLDGPLLEPGTHIEIAAPGIYPLPGSGWQFELRRYDGPRSGPAWAAVIADPWAAPLDASRLELPLVIRTRRRGDRFKPMGVGGTKKVSDFMIDQKIPAGWRDHLPLLVSGGEIAWVCGWRVDQRFAVTAKTGEVWLARFSSGGNEQTAR